jgi:hypothetical protein
VGRSLGVWGEFKSPKVEFPFGENGAREQLRLFDQPTLGTEEQREDVARAPFTERPDPLFEAGEAFERRPGMDPTLGERGKELVRGVARLDLPIDLADPAQGNNVDQLDTPQNGPGLAGTGAAPVAENLGGDLGGMRGELVGSGARFEAGCVDVDPAPVGGLPGAVFDRFPAEAQTIGPGLMHRQHPHDATWTPGGRAGGGT